VIETRAHERESPAERPGAALARFQERRGHRVFAAAGALWTEFRRIFFVPLPYQLRLDPDPRDLDLALRRERVAAVRWPTLTQAGCASGLVALPTAGYSLATVEAKRRRQVRRGLEALDELRLLDPDELLREGLPLNLETMARQRRFEPEFGVPARWRRFVAAVRETPEVIVAGGFRGGRLSTYEIACRDGAWVHGLYKYTRDEDLPRYTNIALEFWVLSLAAATPGVEAVWGGFVTLLPRDPLHRLKLDLGFRVVPHDLGVRFHPALEPLLANRWSAAAARAAARLRPGSASLDLLAKHLAGAARTRRSIGGRA
jgi:hypothetical protein